MRATACRRVGVSLFEGEKVSAHPPTPQNPGLTKVEAKPQQRAPELRTEDAGRRAPRLSKRHPSRASLQRVRPSRRRTSRRSSPSGRVFSLPLLPMPIPGTPGWRSGHSCRSRSSPQDSPVLPILAAWCCTAAPMMALPGSPLPPGLRRVALWRFRRHPSAGQGERRRGKNGVYRYTDGVVGVSGRPDRFAVLVMPDPARCRENRVGATVLRTSRRLRACGERCAGSHADRGRASRRRPGSPLGWSR